MPVLVTGGTGFLGQKIVQRLLEQGRVVRCVSRHRPDAAPWLPDGAEENCEFVEADLTEPSDCESIVDGCDIVIHAASSLYGSVPYLFLTNVVGTENLLAAVMQCRVARLVHVSSLAVYGVQGLKARGVLDEHCPLDTRPHLRDPYTYSKVVQERIVWETLAASPLSHVVIRPGVVYGPNRPIITSRVGLTLGNVLLRMGKGRHLPYTYVDNCADAIVAAAFADGVSGKAINVIDDRLPSSRQLIRASKRAGRRLRVVNIPNCFVMPLSRLNQWYSRRTGDQLPMVITPYKSEAIWKDLRYDNSLAKRLLKWEPSIDLDEGLRRTLYSG